MRVTHNVQIALTRIFYCGDAWYHNFMKENLRSYVYRRLCTLAMSAVMFICTGCNFNNKGVSNSYPIIADPAYGNTIITMTQEELHAIGISYGDSVNLDFSTGVHMEHVPYLSGYYAPIGKPVVTPTYSKQFLIYAVVKSDGTWNSNNFGKNDNCRISLCEKDEFDSIEKVRSVKYSNERRDYPNDETFANFRSVSAGNIKPGILYRSASPINNERGRAAVADKLCMENSIKYILDLSDSNDDIQKHFASAEFNSPYFLELYSAGNVYALDMDTMYNTAWFQNTVVEGMIALSEAEEGPYCIHCIEGKDRTGFVCILLEMLCDASYEEIKQDFLKTYENYYSFTEQSDPNRAAVIMDTIMDPMIRIIMQDETADIRTENLQSSAEHFLLTRGMNVEQIYALMENLTGQERN